MGKMNKEYRSFTEKKKMAPNHKKRMLDFIM